MSKHWIFRVLPLLLAGLLGIAHAGPLSFKAALELAEQQSPNMAANTAQYQAAQASAIPAGALPDPKLFVGVENYPVSGMDSGHLKRDFMTMQKFGVMQEVPNSAKRKAREDIAGAGIEIASAQRLVLRQQLRRDTSVAWLNRYYLERKVSLFDELDRENKRLADAVRAQIAGGKSPAADAVMPRQEAVQLADRRDELTRDLTKARAVLRRLIGTAADGGIAGEPPVLSVSGEHLHRQLEQHPELLAFAAGTRKAEAEVREADAMKRSDWGVALAYQKRAPEFGDMVSVQLTFDLPIATGRRQDPLIAAKRLELNRIDAEREAMLREHVNQLENELADYAALTNQLERAEKVALPLAQEKVDLQTAGYKAGRGDLSAVLAARRELIDQRLKVIELQSQRAAMAAQLHFAYGDIAQ